MINYKIRLLDEQLLYHFYETIISFFIHLLIIMKNNKKMKNLIYYEQYVYHFHTMN